MQQEKLSRRELLEKWKAEKKRVPLQQFDSNKQQEQPVVKKPYIIKQVKPEPKKPEPPAVQPKPEPKPADDDKKLRHLQKCLKSKDELIEQLKGKLARAQQAQDEQEEHVSKLQRTIQKKNEAIDKFSNEYVPKSWYEEQKAQVEALEAEVSDDKELLHEAELELVRLGDVAAEFEAKFEYMKRENKRIRESVASAVEVQVKDAECQTVCSYDSLIRQAEFIAQEFNSIKFSNELMFQQMQNLQQKHKRQMEEIKAKLSESKTDALTEQVIAQYEMIAMESIAKEIERRQEVEKELSLLKKQLER